MITKNVKYLLRSIIHPHPVTFSINNLVPSAISGSYIRRRPLYCKGYALGLWRCSLTVRMLVDCCEDVRSLWGRSLTVRMLVDCEVARWLRGCSLEISAVVETIDDVTALEPALASRSTAPNRWWIGCHVVFWLSSLSLIPVNQRRRDSRLAWHSQGSTRRISHCCSRCT